MALTKIGSSGITSNALTSLAVADGTIQAVDLADGAVTNDKLAGSITSGKITSVANTAITGLVTAAQIANVANTQITGLVTSAQIANTAVTAGVYGGSSNSALITVDSQGRITAASNVAASGYSGPNIQLITAPGTFTVPPGIASIKVSIFGGGGGGTDPAFESSGSTGGTGGRGVKFIPGLTSGASIPVTIGNGGGPNGVGNSSSFGPYISATGGNGGNGIGPGGTPGNPGNPGNSPASFIGTFTTVFTQSTYGGGGGNAGGQPGAVIVEW